MFEFYFTFRALTLAQNARGVLHTAGIRAVLARAPKQFSTHGCGYIIKVNARDVMQAHRLLKSSGASFVHLYKVFRNGTIEEVRL